MIEIEASVVIDEPIDKVFEFVTKPENDARWYFGLESWDHTPGEPAGVGSTSQSRIRFLGIPIEVTWEVVGYEHPRSIEVTTIEGPVKIEAAYGLESVGGDQTRLTVHGEADLKGIFDLAEPLVERRAQRQWEGSLENLKDVLETTG